MLSYYGVVVESQFDVKRRGWLTVDSDVTDAELAHAQLGSKRGKNELRPCFLNDFSFSQYQSARGDDLRAHRTTSQLSN
jgi:hypothetical protein